MFGEWHTKSSVDFRPGAAYIRKVRTASGATAVQIAANQGGRDKVLEHLGSAHTDSELAAPLEAAQEKLFAGQQELDLDLGTTTCSAPTITGKRFCWLIEVIAAAWRRLGFDVVDNEAFFQLVTARIVEPTSVADASRVLRETGIAPVHRNTFVRTLQRCTAHGYRDDIAAVFRACRHRRESEPAALRRHDLVFRSREGRRASQGRILQGAACGPADRRRVTRATAPAFRWK